MSTAAELILSAVRAAMPAGVMVYDNLVTGVPPARYVILYIPAGARSARGVDAVSDCVYLSFQATSVASDSNPSYAGSLCRWLATAVQDSLTDLRITATGWAPAQILHEGSQSPQPDETTPEKKVFATDQFSLETVRLS